MCSYPTDTVKTPKYDHFMCTKTSSSTSVSKSVCNEAEGPGDSPRLPCRQPRDQPLLDAAQQEHQAVCCQVPREMLAS